MKSKTWKLSSSVLSPSAELTTAVDSGRRMPGRTSRFAGYLRLGSVKLVALFAAAFALCSTPALQAQTASYTSGSVNLGSVAVGGFSSTTLTFTFGTVGTIAAPAVMTQGVSGLDFVDGGTGTCTSNGTGHTYSAADTCTVDVSFSPTHPGQRMGAVQLLDNSSNVLATAYIYGFGTGPQVAFSSATTRTIGTFGAPRGIITDSRGNVYVADATATYVTKLNAVSGLVPASPSSTTIGSGIDGPTGIAIDGAGNIWVSEWDQGAGIYDVVEIEAVAGVIPASPNQRNFGQGFYNYIQGICVDGHGNVYAADAYNNQIAELVAVNGRVPDAATPIVVGNYQLFNNPEGVAVDFNGNVFVADENNHTVEEMVAVGGVVPNSPTIKTLGSGWHSPTDVAVDGNGNVFVADAYPGPSNNTIKEIVAVNGVIPASPTILTIKTGLVFPYSVAVDGSGNAYYLDADHNAYIYLTSSVPPSLTFPTTGVGSTSASQTVTLYNNGNASLSFPVPGSGNNPSISTGFILGGGSTCPLVTTSGPAGSLASGSSCTDIISFQPVAGGSISGSLVNTDNASPSTQSISLSGTATGVTPTKVVLTAYTTPLAVNTALGSVTANLEDNSNVTDTNNTSSVTFTLTGPAGFTTVTSTVNAAAGVATGSFPTALTIAGNYSLTAASSGLTTSPAQTIVVNPGAAASLAVTGFPSPSYVAQGNIATVKAYDAYGNVATGFSSTVNLSTTDGLATFGTSLHLSSGSNVVYGTFGTPGTQTITASYSGLTSGSEAGIVVNADPTYVVNNTGDGSAVPANCPTNGGSPGPGNCTLRDAVTAANAITGVPISISFDSTVFATPQTITLTNNTLNLTGGGDSITINGTGQSNTIISGNNLYEIFFTPANEIASLKLSNLTLTNGHTSGSGGNINNGNSGLTLTNVTIANGTASGGAGGIYSWAGMIGTNVTFTGNSATAGSSGGVFGGVYGMNCTNCTFTNNTATGQAAILNSNLQGSTFTNSLFSGNTAVNSLFGSGVSYINMVGSTITGNTITGTGSIFLTGGSLELENTTITGNTVASGAIVDVSGQGGDLDFVTLYGNSATDVNLGSKTLTVENSIVANNTGSACVGCTLHNSITSTTNLALAPLANYGGTQQTLLPLPGSAAICSGSSAYLNGLTTDERGFARKNTTYTGYNSGHPCIDAGAVQTNYTSVQFIQQPTTIAALSVINPAVTVSITENGNTVDNVPLTVSYSGGAMSGTLTQTTAGASAPYFATFADLAPQAASPSVTLTASVTVAPGVTVSATSNTFPVGAAPQTITFAPSSPVVNGVTPITLTALGGGSGNAVTFSIVSGPGSLNGSILTVLGAGNIVIAADQAGNSNFLAAPTVQGTIVVTAAPISYTVPGGPIPVGSSSGAQQATVTFTADPTIGSIVVVTQGATGLDFAYAAGGTCAVNGTFIIGSACTVDYTFNPTAPGVRMGAILVYDTSNNLVGTSYITGIGTGPLAVYANTTSGNYLPSAQTNLGSGFNLPSGIAMDGNGNIFVADNANSAIKELVAPAYTTINTLGGGFSFANPVSVAVDGAGNVFVADANHNQIEEILAPGYTTTNIIATGFNLPVGIAVDGSGNLFVADNNNSAVKELTSASGYATVITLGSGFNHPYGVAVDGSGNVFVGDFGNNAVKEILAPGYTTVNTLGSGFTHPDGVALDANGDVYVAAYGNNAVKEILAAGGYTTVNTLVAPISTPAGIVLDPVGNVFVSSQSGNHVVKLNYATPPSLQFVPTDVLASSAPQMVTLSNVGNTTLTYTAPTVGTSSYLISGPCTSSTTLSAGTNCAIDVAFNPQTTGPLPDAVTITDNTNNASPAATQTIALSGNGYAVTTASLPDVTVGVPYTQTLTEVGGNAPITWSYTGTLPAGLTLHPSTGILDGTPTEAGDSTLFAFTITATDSTSPTPSTASHSYSFNSLPATVVINTLTIPDPKVGVAYNQAIIASGGTAPYTFTLASGFLPAGLTLQSNGHITGTPTEAGPFTFSVTGADSSTWPQNPAGVPFTATSGIYTSFSDAPTIVVPLNVPQITVGIPYSLSLAAHGGTAPYTYTLFPPPGSVLPAGITLDPHTGLLSGTAITGGPYTFTIQTTDSSTTSDVSIISAPFSVTQLYAITVTPQPSAFVTPTNINFSTIPTGTTSNTWTVTLNNTTGTPMLITNWVLTDPINFSYTKTCGSILYAYQNCNILLTFNPQTTGTFNGSLTVFDSSIQTSQTITLSGTSTSNLPTVQVSPTNVAFSSQPVGSTGNTTTVTVSNTSAFPLNIASILLNDTTDFQLISTGCGPILPANSTCNLQVAFRPQSVGDFTASVVITDNATPLTTQTITLSGTGTSNLPTVLVSPTSIAFSSEPVGVTGNAWTVTLSNTSSFSLTITSISLTDATNFVLNSGCGATLGPNSTCNMTVAFKPTYVGNFTGALNILDNATPATLQTVTLSGTSTSNTPTVQVSPTYIAFTSEPVGVQGNAWTVTVSNTSGFPLSIAGIALSDPLDFVLVNGCGSTLGAYSTCNLQVSFKPASLGTFTGSLTITDNASPSTQVVTLSGTSTSNSPTVQVSPTAINFTSEPVGITGNAWTVTVSNTSAFPLNIASILLSNPADFTLASGCGAILGPYSSCNLSVAFKPTTVGNINGALTITDDASPTTQVVVLNGTGTSNLPTVQVSPSAINFSSEPVGVAGNAWTVAVSNTSAFPLNIASIAVSDPTDFLLGNGCGSILPAYNTCNLTLTFRPQSVAALSANLIITDNASPGTQVVPLTGTGTSNSPVVQVSPSAVNFGSLTIGTTGNPTTLTVSNTSSFPLNIASILVSDPADYLLTNGCGATLGAFSSCNLTVAFRPQGVGGLNATLTITDDASPATQVVLLSGTGTALLTNVQVSPTSIAFSTQAANTTSNPVTVNFSNMGGSAVTIGSISVSDASNFTEANSCGSLLGPFSSCSILVYFTPQAAGSYTANLVVTSNGNPITLTVPLSGTSTGPAIGPGYSLSVNPSNVTVVAGNPATTTFTFTPVGGYVGTVAFSCSGLPAGATCSFAPPSVTADGLNTIQTSLLTITTTASGVALISENRTNTGPTLAAVFFLPALLFGSLIAWRRRSFTARVRGLLLLLLVGTAVVGGAIGCTGPVSQATPLGTHVVTVVANASVKASSGTSTTTQTASFTLTVIQK